MRQGHQDGLIAVISLGDWASAESRSRWPTIAKTLEFVPVKEEAGRPGLEPLDTDCHE